MSRSRALPAIAVLVMLTALMSVVWLIFFKQPETGKSDTVSEIKRGDVVEIFYAGSYFGTTKKEWVGKGWVVVKNPDSSRFDNACRPRNGAFLTVIGVTDDIFVRYSVALGTVYGDNNECVDGTLFFVSRSDFSKLKEHFVAKETEKALIKKLLSEEQR